MMICMGRSDREDLCRCGSCPSPLRNSSSKLELPFGGAKGHLFGMDRHGLHDIIAKRSFLVVASSVKSE
jgi:hypothetical protein